MAIQRGRSIAFSEFLTTSEFAETVFENWESELLQKGFWQCLRDTTTSDGVNGPIISMTPCTVVPSCSSPT